MTRAPSVLCCRLALRGAQPDWAGWAAKASAAPQAWARFASLRSSAFCLLIRKLSGETTRR